MIVGLVRPVANEHDWQGFKPIYAQFLAYQLASDHNSKVLEVCASNQVDAAQEVRIGSALSSHANPAKQAMLRNMLLRHSQILDIYMSEILVLDFVLKTKDGLEAIQQWTQSVCALNKLLENSDACPCSWLNQEKHAYIVVNWASTKPLEERKEIEIRINRLLNTIGLNKTTIFFRKSQELREAAIVSEPSLETVSVY